MSATVPAERVHWRSRLARLDMRVTPYLLISPFFILFLVFGLFPLAFNGYVSLRTWRLDDPASDGWAGLSNYRQLFSDGDFVHALVNTFGIFMLATVPQLLAALIIAGLLNRPLRARTFLRIAVLIPYVTPITATALIFAFVFQDSQGTGLANLMLGLVHLGPFNWHADRIKSWFAIATMVNWRWIGYNSLIYLAAMQSIPRDLYEAASLDGASVRRQFWRITVPLLRPTIIFTIVLSTIGNLQLFTEPLLFDTNVSAATGGSDGQFDTVAMLIYKTGWKDLNLGYAAAMSWALFLIIVVISVLNASLTNRIGGKK